MQILNKVYKIKKTDNLSSEYIEEYFKEKKLDVLKWAIVAIDDCDYILNVSVVE